MAAIREVLNERRWCSSSTAPVCPEDGCHFRGFINDQGFMQQVLEKVRPETALGSAV